MSGIAIPNLQAAIFQVLVCSSYEYEYKYQVIGINNLPTGRLEIITAQRRKNNFD